MIANLSNGHQIRMFFTMRATPVLYTPWHWLYGVYMGRVVLLHVVYIIVLLFISCLLVVFIYCLFIYCLFVYLFIVWVTELSVYLYF